jgi:hypothetical protein
VTIVKFISCPVGFVDKDYHNDTKKGPTDDENECMGPVYIAPSPDLFLIIHL